MLDSKLLKYNLNEILDMGLSGGIHSLTQDDWLLLDSLINQACRTASIQGANRGYKNGYRAAQNEANKGEEDVI